MKKRIVSFIAMVAVSAYLAAPAFAAAPQKIKSLHPDFSGKLYSASVSGENTRIPSLQSLDVHPGSELTVILSGSGTDTDLFLDQNGKPIKTADVTASRMRATGVVPEVYAESGSELVESFAIVVLNAGTPAAKPALRVCFAPDFDGLEPESFDFTVYISIGGVKQEQSGIKIAGTLGLPEVSAYSYGGVVYADGFVVAAREDIPYIELYAGYGITAATSMRQGGRYRLQARASDDPYDAAIMERLNALTDVIVLDCAGFEDGGISGVRIETEETLSVYDENGELIGETARSGGIPQLTKSLPFREKYYLVWRDHSFDIYAAGKPVS